MIRIDHAYPAGKIFVIADKQVAFNQVMIPMTQYQSAFTFKESILRYFIVTAFDGNDLYFPIYFFKIIVFNDRVRSRSE
jgi:hypothetical protein